MDAHPSGIAVRRNQLSPLCAHRRCYRSKDDFESGLRRITCVFLWIIGDAIQLYIIPVVHLWARNGRLPDMHCHIRLVYVESPGEGQDQTRSGYYSGSLGRSDCSEPPGLWRCINDCAVAGRASIPTHAAQRLHIRPDSNVDCQPLVFIQPSNNSKLAAFIRCSSGVFYNVPDRNVSIRQDGAGGPWSYDAMDVLEPKQDSGDLCPHLAVGGGCFFVKKQGRKGVPSAHGSTVALLFELDDRSVDPYFGISVVFLGVSLLSTIFRTDLHPNHDCHGNYGG